MVRTADNGLPAAGAPVDFDTGEPFITKGRGPGGELVEYYNFDGTADGAGAHLRAVSAGRSQPVEGQLNIVDVVPGDTGYNDFWAVSKVTVPADYVANTITSVSEILDAGLPVAPTDMLVNCPIVPYGSTAKLRFKPSESPDLTRGWYPRSGRLLLQLLEADLAPTAARCRLLRSTSRSTRTQEILEAVRRPGSWSSPARPRRTTCRRRYPEIPATRPSGPCISTITRPSVRS